MVVQLRVVDGLALIVAFGVVLSWLTLTEATPEQPLPLLVTVTE